jgi:Flp pilus assembly protein TadG
MPVLSMLTRRRLRTVSRPGRLPGQRPVSARRAGRNRGQALVEFALVLPVFLLMTVGIVDFTRVFTSYISLTNGVREAAIFAADGTGYTKWCKSGGSVVCPAGTAATNQAADPLNIAYRIDIEAVGLTKSQITMAKPRCATSSGTQFDCTATSSSYQTVTIRASYPVPVLTPIIGNFFGGSIKLNASTTAWILQ